MTVERRNRTLAPVDHESSHLETMLTGNAPVIAVSDYVRAFPGQIAPYLQAPLTTLGTDDFGRSAHRKALRRFFEVDREHIALAALQALVKRGEIPADILKDACRRFGIGSGTAAPWTR